MNKVDIIEALAEREGLTAKEAKDIVTLILSEFRDALQDGERIDVRGFGSFSVREYAAYTGRNPRNGERVEVAAKRLPFFKASKELKGKINAE